MLLGKMSELFNIPMSHLRVTMNKEYFRQREQLKRSEHSFIHVHSENTYGVLWCGRPCLWHQNSTGNQDLNFKLYILEVDLDTNNEYCKAVIFPVRDW